MILDIIALKFMEYAINVIKNLEYTRKRVIIIVYKRIILDVELPEDYDESKIDKALENAIKNKKGKVFNKYIYQDIDKDGKYIEGGQL